MAKTRAEVLAALRELGLTTDEANEELRAREAQAEKLVAAAPAAAREDALLVARQLVRLERPLYITKNLDPQPAKRELAEPAEDETEQPDEPEVIAAVERPARAATVREALRLWSTELCGRLFPLLTGPNWRRALVAALPVIAVSLALAATLGAFDSAKSDRATGVAETLGTRGDAIIPTSVPPAEPHVVQAPAFQVSYTLTKKRLDGGKTLYVLIDPLDTSTPFFKDDLKQLVKDIAGQYGTKISIEIHDNPTSLADSYKRFGEKSAKLPMTAEESNNEALHFIASFSGELNTGMYLNTLQFFSAANPDTPTVGKYIEDIDFDPTK